MTGALLAAPLPAAAQEPSGDRARTVIVLDVSNSMWGEIGGRDKIDIARETLGTVLQSVPLDQDLGLVAYGHRRRGDCTDIEELVPPSPAATSIGAIAGAARDLRPVGRTPLTEATRFAAERVRYTEERATVVVVTDGVETCEADPCAAARELERDGIDFTAHVVGFGLSAQEGAQVACLAEETGGRYIQASDADALADALTAVVAQAPGPEPEPEPVVRTVGIDVRDGNGGPLLTARQITGRLVPLDAGAADAPVEAEAEYDPDPVGAASLRADLAPGRYRLEVVRDYGNGNPPDYREVPYAIEIVVEGRGDERLSVVLPGGLLSVQGLVHAGEPLPDTDFASADYLWTRADYAVHRVVDGAPEETPWFAHTIDFGPTGLPAGAYLIRGTLGMASAELRVTVEDGDLIEDVMDFEAARLRLALHYDDGRPMEAGLAYATVCPLSEPRCGSWLSIGDATDPVRLFVPSGEEIVLYGHHYYSDGSGDKGSTAASAIIAPLAPGEDRLVELRAETNPPDFWERVDAADAARAAGGKGAAAEDEARARGAAEGGTDAETDEVPDASLPPEGAVPATSGAGNPRSFRILAGGADYGTVALGADGLLNFTPADAFCRIAPSCAPDAAAIEPVGAPEGVAEGTFTVADELFRVIVAEGRGTAVLMVSDAMKLAERPPVTGELHPVADPQGAGSGRLEDVFADLAGVWIPEALFEADPLTCAADPYMVHPNGVLVSGSIPPGAESAVDLQFGSAFVCEGEPATLLCEVAEVDPVRNIAALAEEPIASRFLAASLSRQGDVLRACQGAVCMSLRDCTATLESAAPSTPLAASLLGAAARPHPLGEGAGDLSRRRAEAEAREDVVLDSIDAPSAPDLSAPMGDTPESIE